MKKHILLHHKRILAMLVAVIVAIAFLVLMPLATTAEAQQQRPRLRIHGVEVPDDQMYIEQYYLRIPLHRLQDRGNNNSVRIVRSNNFNTALSGQNRLIDLMRNGAGTHSLALRITFNDIYSLDGRGNFFVITETSITLPSHQGAGALQGLNPFERIVDDVTINATDYVKVGLSNNIFLDFTHHARRNLPLNTAISYFNSITITVYNYMDSLPLINHSGSRSVFLNSTNDRVFNLTGTQLRKELVSREVINPYSPYFNLNFGNTGDNYSINVETGVDPATPNEGFNWRRFFIIAGIVVGAILVVVAIASMANTNSKSNGNGGKSS
ncbi:MAG: hypothetical protein FWE22_01170 [Firmicutes bacterium]|nr:hypothetical protein [Bacillota bacterium]